MNIINSKFIASLIFLMFFISCSNEKKSEATKSNLKESAGKKVEVPDFNADSAYIFVEKQVSFGPRVPNTESHKKCSEFLIETLERFSDTVYVQKAKVRAYDGTVLNIKNIIGSFNPEKRKRVLLCAHWDTRPFADYDPDPENHYSPIDGANDGASGVAVLLEIARLLNNTPIDKGVDIIFFDAEDYGEHANHKSSSADTWALGSQHWAKNPHIGNYYANYGILLDMVGAENAKFYHEEYSYYFAPGIVRKVWDTAHNIGYSDFFIKQRVGHILDDHYYINTIRNIPTINIIHQNMSSGHNFFEQWHTMDDTIDYIDPETLKAVGQTVTTVLYKD